MYTGTHLVYTHPNGVHPRVTKSLNVVKDVNSNLLDENFHLSYLFTIISHTWQVAKTKYSK